MAHFAKISEENVVLQVLTLADKDCQNEEGIETESVGQTYLETHNNWPAHLWIQTSYNTFHNQHKLSGTPFRGNYAHVGGTWDIENQIFWPEKPFGSWTKNTTTAKWECPAGDPPALTAEQISQMSADPDSYHWVTEWNETTTSWEYANLKS